jgi:hypothetical protein
MNDQFSKFAYGEILNEESYQERIDYGHVIVLFSINVEEMTKQIEEFDYEESLEEFGFERKI